MPSSSQEARKTPKQSRSAVTVEAIFTAAIQVLLRDGPSRLTTTRVATRAGVSVGTIYQYFPNKLALLYALLERHLGSLAKAVEEACEALRGRPVLEMSDELVRVFLDARTAEIETARMIYLLAADLDTDGLLTAIRDRIRTAITGVLASAADARFACVDTAGHMLSVILSGATRTVLERDDPGALEIVRARLPLACAAYLTQAAQPKP